MIDQKPTVIFENKYFIAIDKPCGWLSVPGRTGEKDTRPVAGRWLEAELAAQIWPIHRLDAEVSGVIVFAKNADAHRYANRAFEKQQVQKIYEALTAISPSLPTMGIPQQWNCKLARGKKRAYEAEFGKDSSTVATYLGTLDSNQHPGEALAHWRLEPKTGRSHQLRFELFRHECPIVGDSLYGSNMAWPDGIALRATRIVFGETFENWQVPESLSVPGYGSLMAV